MDGRRGKIAAALVAASVCVLGVASAAQAATITAYPPAYAKPGTGPFTWTFAPSVPDTPVAWKLSSETAWHRCTTDTSATFASLPEGRYSLSVMDDTPDCADTDTGQPVAPPLPPSRRPQLVVDGTPPVVPVPVVAVTGSPVPKVRYVTITAPPSDALSGVASVLWNTGDGAQPLRGTTRGPFGWRYALGIFSGTVTVTDRAGNVASQPFTVNTLPPPDLTRPTFAVNRVARGVLARRNLRVTLAASERATVSIAATIHAAGRTYRLPVTQRAVLAKRTVPVRIAVKRDVRRAIARSLRRHRPVRATVTLVATDRAGNRSAATTITRRIVG
jgi:hypothetical protein